MKTLELLTTLLQTDIGEDTTVIVNTSLDSDEYVEVPVKEFALRTDRKTLLITDLSEGKPLPVGEYDYKQVCANFFIIYNKEGYRAMLADTGWKGMNTYPEEYPAICSLTNPLGASPDIVIVSLEDLIKGLINPPSVKEIKT